MLRLVASSWASLSASPSSRKLTRLRSVAASQLGLGKLPMVVAAMGGSCITSPLKIFLCLYLRQVRKTSRLLRVGLSFDPVRLSLSSQVFRELHHALRRGWIVVLVVEALSHTVHLSAL